MQKYASLQKITLFGIKQINILIDAAQTFLGIPLVD